MASQSSRTDTSGKDSCQTKAKTRDQLQLQTNLYQSSSSSDQRIQKARLTQTISTPTTSRSQITFPEIKVLSRQWSKTQWPQTNLQPTKTYFWTRIWKLERFLTKNPLILKRHKKIKGPTNLLTIHPAVKSGTIAPDKGSTQRISMCTRIPNPKKDLEGMRCQGALTKIWILSKNCKSKVPRIAESSRG